MTVKEIPVQITLRQAVEAVPALQDLVGQKGIRARDSWDLARLIRALNAEVATYHELRNRLIEQFGVPIPGQPGMYRFEGEGREEIDRRHAELLAQTIDLPPARVRLSDLDRIAPAALLAVEWLIEDDSPADEPADQAAKPVPEARTP